jgi:hypothetical protein
MRLPQSEAPRCSAGQYTCIFWPALLASQRLRIWSPKWTKVPTPLTCSCLSDQLTHTSDSFTPTLHSRSPTIFRRSHPTSSSFRRNCILTSCELGHATDNKTMAEPERSKSSQPAPAAATASQAVTAASPEAAREDAQIEAEEFVRRPRKQAMASERFC